MHLKKENNIAWQQHISWGLMSSPYQSSITMRAEYGYKSSEINLWLIEDK